jgi:hypothetical protein
MPTVNYGGGLCLPLIEPVPIDDDLCTGIARVEDLGFAARLVLYTDQTSYETGQTVHVVKRKIVLPPSALPPAIREMFLAMREARDRVGVLHRVR